MDEPPTHMRVIKYLSFYVHDEIALDCRKGNFTREERTKM